MVHAKQTFSSYMLDFYGTEGLYPMGMTADEVLYATVVHVNNVGAQSFEGDSVDRESVRDIVLAQRELNTPVTKVNLEEVR